MTDEALAAIERTWSPSPDGYGLDVSTDPDSMKVHAANVLALVAEVRRLRALVQKAYAEGQFTTSYYGNGYIDTQPWDESDACKALDADKTPQDGVS
jgi:hypothetical protein